MGLMSGLGRIVAKHPKISILSVIMITIIATASIQVFGIDQEFSEDSFMPDVEMVEASNEISEKYTTTKTLSLLAKSKNNDVLTSDSLVEILKIERNIANESSIHENLENSANPSSNIVSVADIIAQNALYPQGITYPTYEQKIQVLKSMSDIEIKLSITVFLNSSQASDQLKGIFTLMLTKDFDFVENVEAKATMISISLNASKDQGGSFSSEGTDIAETEYKIEEIVEDTETENLEISVMGENIISNEILEANNESMSIVLPIAFLLVIVILVIIYRSFSDLIFSLLALVFSIIWVYGFGSAMGFTFNPMTTAVPVLIVGLGIDYGIHITMRYREEIKNKVEIDKSVVITIASVGVALLLATFTTVVAFLSNIVSPMRILGEFGVLCAIGIVGSFVNMTTFVPACQQVRDQRRQKKGKLSKNKDIGSKSGKIKNTGASLLNKIITFGAIAGNRHSAVVLIIAILITSGSAVVATQLDTKFDFEDFLPDDLEISEDLDFMMNEFDIQMDGGEKINILIQSDISEPEILTAVADVHTNLKDSKYVVKHGDVADADSVYSVMFDWSNDTSQFGQDNYNASFAQLYSQYMNAQGVPKEETTSEDIKTLYNWLYQNPSSTKSIANVLHLNEEGEYDGAVIRVSVDADSNNEEEVTTLHNDLKEDIKPLEKQTDDVFITDGPILTKTTMDLLNESQIRSLIITIIVSLILLTLIFWYKWKSFVLGAITITPVVFCVAWTLGTMYLINISLNMMTITIASLTIGLGITYGIHLTHRFLEDLENNGSFIEEAAKKTLSHTGSALFGAATTTIAGFGLLIFTLMPPLKQFGAITALTILYSFLASVFVLPTLLIIWAKRRRKKDLK